MRSRSLVVAMINRCLVSLGLSNVSSTKFFAASGLICVYKVPSGSNLAGVIGFVDFIQQRHRIRRLPIR